MGYWEEVREVVLKGVDLAVEGVKDGAAKAVEKGKDGVNYTQLKTNLFVEQRKLQTILADLGDRTRDIYREKKDLYSDPIITEVMEKLLKVEDECKRLEAEIKKLGFEAKK
jgi:hypothetical protein